MVDSCPDRGDEIHSTLVEILNQHCDLEGNFGPQTRLQADLGMDSMALLNFALEVENRFEIFLNEAPDRPPETLGEVVELVNQALREQREAP